MTSFTKFNGQPPLTDDALRANAPSIFAAQAWGGCSERYRFIPTSAVVEALRETGWFPVAANQGRCRIAGKGDFTKHLIRFRRSQDNIRVGDDIFEIVLVNSHDRTGGYQLSAGLFRVACLNGLIVAKGEIGGISVRHSGPKELPARVIEASAEVIADAPRIADQVNRWRGLELSDRHRAAYAAAAVEVVDGEGRIEPDRLLASRRPADQGRDLWTTTNVVQENLIRGGVRAVGETGRRYLTRGVGAVSENVRINRALWRLSEELAKAA